MMCRRRVFAAAGTVAILVSTVSAATYSTNTVEGLVWLLRNKNGDKNVIELAPGDYHLCDDLTWYTNSSISAHPADPSVIADGEEKGQTGGGLGLDVFYMVIYFRPPFP